MAVSYTHLDVYKRQASALGAAAAAALVGGGQALGQLLQGDAVDVLVDDIVQALSLIHI